MTPENIFRMFEWLCSSYSGSRADIISYLRSYP